MSTEMLPGLPKGEDVTAVLEQPAIASANLNTDVAPVQVSGRLRDGRWFYFRYRFGHAGLGIGHTWWAAVADQRAEVPYGGEYDGFLERSEELRLVFGRAWDARAGREEVTE